MIAGLAYVRKIKPGKPARHYVYAWRGGPLILSTIGGPRPKLTPAALDRYREAVAGRHSAPLDTIAGLTGAWRASPEWRALATTTRRQWAYKLATIEAKWGAVPLHIFNDPKMRGKVIAWRDGMADTPRSADFHVGVLRSLLAYGRFLGRLTINVAEDMPQLYKGGKRATIIWEANEAEPFALIAPQQVADGFRLAMLTGLRRSDLVAITREADKGHHLRWLPSKGGGERTVTVPVLPELRAFLDELATRFRMPGVETLLVNSRGESWAAGGDGFSSSFDDARVAIGFDKHLHDCRGTFVTKLCLAGLTDAEIAGIVGWSPGRVADIRRVYVDDARVVVAIGERLSRGTANAAANQSFVAEAK